MVEMDERLEKKFVTNFVDRKIDHPCIGEMY